jgi:hypothetical protein
MASITKTVKPLMVGLPELPLRIQQLYVLRWDELIEKWGFTGALLHWHDKQRAPRPTRCPPPCVDIFDRNAVATSREDAFGPRKLPEVIHHRPPDMTKGIVETVALATTRFNDIAEYYFSAWKATGADTDKFSEQLGEIQGSVMDQVAALWQQEADWFKQECQPRVKDALTSLVKGLKRQARKLQIERLEADANGTAAVQAQPAPVAAGNGAAERVPLETMPAEEASLTKLEHEELVARVARNFGCDGKPRFVDFHKPLGVTHSEFCAWKREDTRRCGKRKREALSKAAAALPL